MEVSPDCDVMTHEQHVEGGQLAEGAPQRPSVVVSGHVALQRLSVAERFHFSGRPITRAIGTSESYGAGCSEIVLTQSAQQQLAVCGGERRLECGQCRRAGTRA